MDAIETPSITDAPGFERDPGSRAIISNDQAAVAGYRRRRAHDLQMGVAIEDINNVKADLKEIKLLLGQLLEDRS